MLQAHRLRLIVLHAARRSSLGIQGKNPMPISAEPNLAGHYFDNGGYPLKLYLRAGSSCLVHCTGRASPSLQHEGTLRPGSDPDLATTILG